MTFTKAQLDAMVREANVAYVVSGGSGLAKRAAENVKALAAEVERLTAANDAAADICQHNIELIGKVELLTAERDRLRALHAEIVRELYGYQYTILGWRPNGGWKSVDELFAIRGWDHPESWEPTIDTHVETKSQA